MMRLSTVIAFCFVFASACVFIAIYNQVPREIRPVDIRYIHKILEVADYKPEKLEFTHNYEQQLETIRAVQDAALATTPQTEPIPPDTTREPQDLYKRDAANCSDRSRFMDKALRYLGFETRYAFVRASGEHGLVWHILAGTQEHTVQSHALIEVKTSRGWLFVDSVSPWLALTTENAPVSLEQWQQQRENPAFQWKEQPGGELFKLLEREFVYFYGLYSHHGRFYPPYWPIPDINWKTFLYNFTG